MNSYSSSALATWYSMSNQASDFEILMEAKKISLSQLPPSKIDLEDPLPLETAISEKLAYEGQRVPSLSGEKC